MLRRKYAALLFDRGLHVLSIALYNSKPKELQQLKSLVFKLTDIDLSDPETHLTEDQIERLREFENTYSQFLLNIILGNDLEDPFHTDQILNRELDLREQDIRNTNTNFNFTCWYGACLTFLGIMYLFAITWIPIPPEQLRFADTGLGAIIGSVIQTITNYFFHLRERQMQKSSEQANLTAKNIACEEKKDECE